MDTEKPPGMSRKQKAALLATLVTLIGAFFGIDIDTGGTDLTCKENQVILERIESKLGGQVQEGPPVP